MIKKALLTAVFFIAALPLASHAQLIIGAGINTSLNSDLDFKKNGVTETYDLDTNTASFYIGNKSSSNNRFLIQLDNKKVKIDDFSSYSSTAKGLRLDWQFVYTQAAVKPYWGFGFGFYELKEAPLLPDESQKGVSFQAMGGVKIDLLKKLELDLSLQYQGIVWQDVEVNRYYNSGYYSKWTTEKTSMTSSFFSAGLGLAFKF